MLMDRQKLHKKYKIVVSFINKAMTSNNFYSKHKKIQKTKKYKIHDVLGIYVLHKLPENGISQQCHTVRKHHRFFNKNKIAPPLNKFRIL